MKSFGIKRVNKTICRKAARLFHVHSILKVSCDMGKYANAVKTTDLIELLIVHFHV